MFIAVMDQTIVNVALATIGRQFLTMLFRAFRPAERVRASAILVIPTALAPAVGPVIGGLFVTDVSWRWVFYVNVPVGVFALAFGAVFLADQAHPAAGRFDVPGFVTASLGLGLLMCGVAEGPNAGWTAGPIIACIAAGALLVAAMVVIDLRPRRRCSTCGCTPAGCFARPASC